MHRSPLYALVILVAVAACSTRDATAATELLAQDSTLVARLSTDGASRDGAARRLPLPDACGAVAVAPRPAAASSSQAQELARRGYDAETLGNLTEAKSLLDRASELDGTNESVAYHLGRTNEALGDRAAAVAAYCRFLALTPTTGEATEARARVASLSVPESRVAAGGVGDTTPTRQRHRAAPPRRVSRLRPPARPTVAVAAPARRAAVPAATSDDGTQAYQSSAAAGNVGPSPSPDASAAGAPAVDGRTGGTAAAGDVVAAPDEGTTVGEPSTAARTRVGGPSRAQRAGIGAAAGAIVGAVTGRSVKGALIGAAAGGMLGTAMGGRVGPVGRGIRP